MVAAEAGTMARAMEAHAAARERMEERRQDFMRWSLGFNDLDEFMEEESILVHTHVHE
jgi:hypothetical protein